MGVLKQFYDEMQEAVGEADHDPDKVMDSLDMVIHRARNADDQSMIVKIHEAYLASDEVFGALLRKLITVETMDGVSQSIIQRHAKG